MERESQEKRLKELKKYLKKDDEKKVIKKIWKKSDKTVHNECFLNYLINNIININIFWDIIYWNNNIPFDDMKYITLNINPNISYDKGPTPLLWVILNLNRKNIKKYLLKKNIHKTNRGFRLFLQTFAKFNHQKRKILLEDGRFKLNKPIDYLYFAYNPELMKELYKYNMYDVKEIPEITLEKILKLLKISNKKELKKYLKEK